MMRLHAPIAVALALLTACCVAQSAKEPDGPASQELRDMAKADQAGRTGAFDKAKLDAMVAEDAKRRERVATLLDQDKLVTAGDYDNAGLIFQHGDTPESYLVAHELYFISQLKGRISNGLAISEDRWLISIGRKQRFGSQFEFEGMKLKPTDEGTPTSVTDDFRLDFFMPPLEAGRKKGPTAVQDVFDAVEKRLNERLDKNWITKQAATPEADELKRLTNSNHPSFTDLGRVVELYNSGQILTPNDYLNAAQVLKHSRRPSELLLAHELACVAAIRKEPGGAILFAETLDRFLISQGEYERYGTMHNRGMSNVTTGVIKALGLSSS